MKKITEKEAYIIAISNDYDKEILKDIGFEYVETINEDFDEEDGGGHYTKIVKEISTGNFYSLHYCDWDILNTDFDEDEFEMYENGRCDLSTKLKQVKPKKITKTIYE